MLFCSICLFVTVSLWGLGEFGKVVAWFGVLNEAFVD